MFRGESESNDECVPAFFSCSVNSAQLLFIRSRSAIHRSACSCGGMPSHLFSMFAKVGFEILDIQFRVSSFLIGVYREKRELLCIRVCFSDLNRLSYDRSRASENLLAEHRGSNGKAESGESYTIEERRVQSRAGGQLSIVVVGIGRSRGGSEASMSKGTFCQARLGLIGDAENHVMEMGVMVKGQLLLGLNSGCNVDKWIMSIFVFMSLSSQFLLGSYRSFSCSHRRFLLPSSSTISISDKHTMLPSVKSTTALVPNVSSFWSMSIRGCEVLKFRSCGEIRITWKRVIVGLCSFRISYR